MENLEETPKMHQKTRDLLEFLEKPAVSVVFREHIFPGFNPNEYNKAVRRGATIKEAIQDITAFKVQQVAKKATSLLDAKLEEDMKTSIAKRRLINHELLEKQLKVVDKEELRQVIAPVFSQIAAGLQGMQRSPERVPEILPKLIEQLQRLGKDMQLEANDVIDNYVEGLMNEELELDIDTEEGKGLSSFD